MSDIITEAMERKIANQKIEQRFIKPSGTNLFKRDLKIEKKEHKK